MTIITACVDSTDYTDCPGVIIVWEEVVILQEETALFEPSRLSELIARRQKPTFPREFRQPWPLQPMHKTTPKSRQYRREPRARAMREEDSQK